MLFRFARPKPRIIELEDEGSFALTIQQAADVRRNARGSGDRAQRCVVVIVVSDDRKNWRDAQEFWTGPWRPTWEGGIPLPSTDDLIDVARRERARYARSVIRSTI